MSAATAPVALVAVPMEDTRTLQMTLRERIYAAHPPRLTDGQLRVLCEMAGDLMAREWAQLWGVPLLEIERAEYWLGAKCQRW